MSKFSVCTFGCRCNQADSAAIREGLCRLSLTEGEKHLSSDLIVVNTCTVTHRTDQQVRQAIRRLHRDNPSARLVVTGCYAERDPEALSTLPGVSLVLGNADKERLPELIKKHGEDWQGKVIRTPLDSERHYLLRSMAQTGGKTRPIIKLQDGCDAHCSYCIVPQVRGPGRSARPEDVIAEIESLIESGFQEIVLTGIHLGAFGQQLRGHARLSDLLRQILELPGLGRIRLSSIEPMHFDVSISALAAGNPLFAPHFHIPLQSGSDRILRRMRRPYRSARFKELLLRLHNEIPCVGIGTDVMVGFPGETNDDFAETCSLLKELPLAYLHVFPFSPRKGTEAFSLPGRIPPDVMRERLAILLEISRFKNLSFRRRFVGQVLPAITLAREEDLGSSLVLTGNYIHARIPGLNVPPNRLVDIRIEDVQPDATYAMLAE
jgi:threonylcarbamoyladenosine tRNA methylthiotransferase MtaB